MPHLNRVDKMGADGFPRRTARLTGPPSYRPLSGRASGASAHTARGPCPCRPGACPHARCGLIDRALLPCTTLPRLGAAASHGLDSA
jgi:hypothetical protein